MSSRADARPRHHLMVLADEHELGRVARERRLWDPVMAAAVPPHVTVVYPEELADVDLLRQRAADVGATFGRFSLSALRVVAEDGGAGGVLLSMDDPSGTWRALRDVLLAPPATARDAVPHLTIAHPRTTGLGPRAWAALRDRAMPTALLADALTVTQTDADGRFRVLDRFPLRVDGPRRLCAAVLLVDDGRVLLARRAAGRAWYPGVWDLPGGHVEPGEPLRAAAVREAREELGVELDAAGLVHLATIVEPDLELVVLAATSWAGRPVNAEPSEHEAIGWFTAAGMSSLDLSDPRLLTIASDALAAPPRA